MDLYETHHVAHRAVLRPCRSGVRPVRPAAQVWRKSGHGSRVARRLHKPATTPGRARMARLCRVAPLSLLLVGSSWAQPRYPTILPDTTATRTLAADETVTYVYHDERATVADLGERYMLVEVRGPRCWRCCGAPTPPSQLSSTCLNFWFCLAVWLSTCLLAADVRGGRGRVPGPAPNGCLRGCPVYILRRESVHDKRHVLRSSCVPACENVSLCGRG